MPNSYFTIYLVGKNDEVLGHPTQKNLNNYCNNNIVKIIKYSQCQESNLNGHKLITIYEATDDPNDDLMGFYYYRKIALMETSLPDYPIFIGQSPFARSIHLFMAKLGVGWFSVKYI